MYEDKTLTCKDCGSDFSFTASEQEFYSEKGFTNDPGRCPECRAARKQRNRGGGFGRGPRTQREMHSATCSACGAETQVPFRPSGERPVYCSDCFTKRSRY
ncbi:MAG: zinc-binding protein [Firmicutes bacterium HGW-Firmicutes-14]|nr:MAG: zinc-binding protein [Firmicutes bacterium HGW-Firmicutes-14]